MTMPAPGRYYREGMSLIELTEVFSDEASATAWFESLIWPDIRACPHCGSTDTFENSAAGESRPYRCRDCHRHLSVRVGTALARSRVPLRKRVFAICPEMTSLEGVSSKKLRAGRGVAGKTAVAGIRDRATGQVTARVVEKTDAETLPGFVTDHPAEGSTVHADEALACKGLPRHHEAVRHSVGEHVRGQVHTNGIEGFRASVRRTCHGTFHHISAGHLQRHVTAGPPCCRGWNFLTGDRTDREDGPLPSGGTGDGWSWRGDDRARIV